MTREMVLTIIEDEKLRNYDFFEGKRGSADEIVITKEDGKWIVFATGERGSMVTNSDFVYDNEEDALEDFVFRLRVANSYLRRRSLEYEKSEGCVNTRDKAREQRLKSSYGKAVD